MQNETDTPAAPDDSQNPEGQAPLNAEAAEFLRMMETLRSSYKELQQRLSSDQIFDALIAGLSSHPNFIKLIRQITLEAMAEQIAVTTSDHSHEHPRTTHFSEPENVKGYRVRWSAWRTDDSILRVARLASDHPTDPDGLDAYVKTGDGEQWERTLLPVKLEAALREEIKDLNTGYYVWVELDVATNSPINDDSQKVELAETTNGPQAD